MKPATAALVLLAACGRIGFDDRVGGDQLSGDAVIPVDALALPPFGIAQPIPTFQATFNYDDPGLSPDGLEIYVSADPTGTQDILVSRRASRADAWPDPVPVPGMDTADTEHSPELTADGLSLYYMRVDELMVATRASSTDPWSIAGTGLVINELQKPAVCDGGRVLYCRIGGDAVADIYVSRRTTTADPWPTPVVVPELSTPSVESGPWVTPDCGRIYFESDRDQVATPYVADFQAETQTFSTPVEVGDLRTQVGRVHDMSLTIDERYMVFVHNSGTEEIWEVSR